MVTVPECKATPDVAALIRRQTGWKLLGSLHRSPSKASKPTVPGPVGHHGGVITVNMSPMSVSVELLGRDSKYQAWVSSAISVPGKGSVRVGLVSAYVPCEGPAAYKTAGMIDSVIESIETEYLRLKPLFPEMGVMLKMDSNLREGGEGRTTEDKDVAAAACKKLRAMFKRLGIESLAGRRGQLPAVMTSRSPNGIAHTDPTRPFLGLAEIDYIAGPTWWGPAQFTVHEAQPWEDVPVGVTHRMIYATVRLPRARDGPAPRPMRVAPHRARALRIPHYDDLPQWDGGAKLLAAFLDRRENAGLFAAGSAALSGTARLQKLCDVFKQIAQACDPAGARLQSEFDRGLHRLPPRADGRRFRGYNLPRHLVHAFERARRMRAEARAKLAGYRLAQAPAAVQRAVRELHAAAERISKTASAEANRTVERRLEEGIKVAEHMRVHDPQGLFEFLRAVCPEDGVDAEDAGDAHKIPADRVEAFKEFYRAQFTADGAAVDGPAGNWPIPRGPGECLAMLFTAAELYHRFYPAAPSVPIPHCVGGGADCKICVHRREQWHALKRQQWDTDRPDAVEIDCSPSLATNSCGGPDGIHPKYVRWTRTADRQKRVPLRMRLMQAVANMFNCWLEEGRVPDEAARCRTVLLRKVDKAGAKLPANDPSSYRGITMSSVFSKAFSIALAHRFSHWAVRYGIVSPEQVGFMPMQGAEDHVVTLLETVRHHWAHKPSTRLCAVFIDFKKAYDRVRPAALWHVLRRMGVPETVVGLLSTWSGQRVTTLAMNGQDGEPWSMTMGVAQGDPLSPLLFNFYLESLIRAIKQDDAFKGVSVEAPAHDGQPAAQFRFKLLVYADDIVLMCESPEQAQLAVNTVQRWAQAWGMELGLGSGKTEAMLFQRPGSAAEPMPAPITVPARQETIQWTREYKYLGYMLRPDLDSSGLLEKMADNVHDAWKRYFYGSRSVRGASPVLALQVYRACVLGAANYLLGIIEPGAAIASYLDTHTKAVTRHVLRCYRRTPVATLWAEGRLPTALTAMMRERTRLYLKMQYTPFTGSVLYQTMGIVKRNAAARPDSRTRPTAASSWVQRTEQLMQQYATKHGVHLLPPVPAAEAGQPPMPAAPPPKAWECGRLAAVYARAVGVMEWQHDTATKLTKKIGLVPQPGGFTVGSEASKEEAAAFFALGYNLTPAQLGQYKSATPLSARGPGCAGALLTSVSRRLPHAAMETLMGARTGREGWRRAGTGAFDAEDVRARAADPVCHSCSGAAEEGPFHACCECPCQATRAVRARVVASLPAFVANLVRLGYDSVRPKEPAPGQAAPVLPYAGEGDPVEEARRLAEAQDWSSDEGKFLLFRLLSMATWPERIPDTVPGPLTALLGRMFDRVAAKPHRLRPLANMWAGWSSKWLVRLRHAYYDHWREADGRVGRR